MPAVSSTRTWTAVPVVLALLAGLLLASPGHADAPGAVPAAPVASAEPGDLVVEEVLEQAQGALAGAPTTADRDVTMVLRDLWLARPRMTAAEREAADRLLARPTDKDEDPYASYQSGAEQARVCSADLPVCVTFVRSSPDRATDAWAARTLETVETSWRTVIDSMGYPAPALDGTDGGDSRFDVYLADISSNGLYGYCAPEAAVPGEPTLAQSYCVLDNDMEGFVMAPQASLAVTAAHEFFHAIQFNIDAGEDLWFMEATATWMEEQVADSVNDNRQFLPAGQLGQPASPLDTYSGDMAMYGNWIFVQYLAQRHGTDAVRRIWELLSSRTGSPDKWSLEGLDAFLTSRNGSWDSFYAKFVEANLTPGRSYDEGRAYRKAKLRDRRVLKAGSRYSLSTRVPHLTSHATLLRPHRSLRGRQRLLVRVVARKRAASPTAVLQVHRRSGKVSRLRIRLGSAGRGSRSVAVSRQSVRRVILVTSNASLRYRNCGRGTTWACGGTPRDDDQRFTVTLRVGRPGGAPTGPS